MATGRPQYPLRIARSTAKATLSRLATERDSETEAYWVGALAEAVQQLLDATAGEGEGK